MNKAVYKTGFWSGMLAFAATVAFVIVQSLQLFRVFPSPLDETLIYAASFAIVIPFILEMLALHYITPEAQKFRSHAALIFTVLYAVFVTANYIVQLATVIPAKLQGGIETIRVLEQTPHSMFWNFDALGYIFMGLASFAAIPVFEKQGIQKWVRISFIANAAATPLIAIVYFYPVYSEKLLALGFVWGITAPWAMLMLAMMFRRKYMDG